MNSQYTYKLFVLKALPFDALFVLVFSQNIGPFAKIVCLHTELHFFTVKTVPSPTVHFGSSVSVFTVGISHVLSIVLSSDSQSLNNY